MIGHRPLFLVVIAAALVAAGCTEQAGGGTEASVPPSDEPEVSCSPTQVQGCGVGSGQMEFAVTDRNGVQELTLALCGDDPPDQVVIARNPTGGITNPEQRAEYAEPAADDIVDELRPTDWDSAAVTLALGAPSDAAPDMQGFGVYTRSQDSLRSQNRWTPLPPGPWPSHPHALTSASGFGQPVRLDTPPGDLCVSS